MSNQDQAPPKTHQEVIQSTRECVRQEEERDDQMDGLEQTPPPPGLASANDKAGPSAIQSAGPVGGSSEGKIASTTSIVSQGAKDLTASSDNAPMELDGTGAAVGSSRADGAMAVAAGAGGAGGVEGLGGKDGEGGKGIHVYGPAQTPLNRSNADLPDSFFEPGLSDVQAHHASVLARSNKLNNAPLLTAKYREVEEKEKERRKADRWPNTTIRVKFSDGTIIEKVFPSTSPIQPVYDFVRSTLNESATSKPFVLWQPPRTQFPEHPTPHAGSKPKPNQPYAKKIIPPANYGPIKGAAPIGLQGGTGGKETLFDLGLVPQSVLLVRWDEGDMNASGVLAPLKGEVSALRVPLPEPSVGGAGTGGSGAGGGGVGEGVKGEEKKEKKIPKWLQKGLMKKK